MKYTYEELSPELKKNLLGKLTVRLIFEGKDDPEKKALLLLLGKNAKEKRRWRQIKNIYMTSIKKNREKLGLTSSF